MNFSIWLSQRLQLAAGGSKANSTGVKIAIAGVAVAVAIMECTIACTTGFKQQISARLMGFDGQVSVLPAYDQALGVSDSYIEASDSLLAVVSQVLPQSHSVIKHKQPGMLKTDNDFAGAYFISYGDGYDYAFERGNIIAGEMPDYQDSEQDNSIVISRMQASALGLEVGDKPYAYFFIDGAVKSRRYTIAGIYETGFSDYDKTAVYASPTTLASVAGITPQQGTELNIAGLPAGQIEQAAADLQNRLIDLYRDQDIDQLYPVDNVKHTGAVFFNWLQLLDTNVVVIFILMACVSGFTLISSMFIIILDRIPVIGLLRALGATRRQVRLIFVNLAMKTVGWGLLIGNIVGIGVLLAQKHWHIVKLNPEMYYLPYAPVHIDWIAFLLLNAAVVIMAWFLLILPSRMAANIAPAQTMRFD